MATGTRRARPSDLAEQEVREQEVRRANRELTAYFRGQRTEREARAALKIIKAFIRYRERLDPASRRPLFVARSRRSTKDRGPKKAASVKITHRRPGRPAPSPAPTRVSAGDEQLPKSSPEPAAGE